MSDDPRVHELLQQLLDSDATPDDVCRDCPELLAEVRRRWERFQRIDAELKALFPSDADSRDASDGPAAPGPGDTDTNPLPCIPGYDVQALIGRGGVGLVYRAHHLALRRTVALKMLRSGQFASASERARFFREAQAVAALRHPHVVQVHDVGEHDGRPFFTMELVEGGSLADRLAGTPQPARQAAATVADLADAIEAAHRAGFVHRDLKPSNVMLDEGGTAKVTDFGLASLADPAAAERLTLSGARMGTPSYMAPEQAAGRHAAVGPATDVYALGAILYETLTGRPPFRGESASETERQVIDDDPVPPSRMNARVPRDLETVCLKCLAKDPRRRYPSAAALAEDLRRFGRGEPVTARRAGAIERIVRWTRRRPAPTAAVAAAVALLLLLAGGGTWIVADRAATTRAITRDLDEGEDAHGRSDWTTAARALDRAALRLGESGGPAQLRDRYDRARRDQELATALEAVRSDVAPFNVGATSGGSDTMDAYAATLSEAGIARVGEDSAAVVARVRASNIRPALIAALDHWHLKSDELETRDWVKDVLRQVDPTPDAWLGRLRTPEALADPVVRSQLIADAPVGEGSLPLLANFGQSLAAARANEAVPFLTRLQETHPDDFWANLFLCEALCRRRTGRDTGEAVRYAQAAVAIRPRSAAAHYYLGAALGWSGRADDATAAFRAAVACDPDLLQARVAMAGHLWRAGRRDEAKQVVAAPYRRALPNRPDIFLQLGELYATVGSDSAAIVRYRQAVALDPTFLPAQRALRTALVRQGRAAEALTPAALADWRKALESGRPASDWEGFAELAAYLGQREEYEWACRTQLDQFEQSNEPTDLEGVGRACLLMPLPPDVLRRATAMIDRALVAEQAKQTWRKPYFLIAKSLAEYRAGRPDVAKQLLQGVPGGTLEPMPKLIRALALMATDDRPNALLTLAGASGAEWSLETADRREQWMFDVLRREGEAAVIPHMPALLSREREPADRLERVITAAAHAAAGRHAARAELWEQALASDPSLIPNRGREFAVAAAVAAGYGPAADVSTDEQRARWREQARRWVREELADADATLAEGDAGRGRLAAILAGWATYRDLAPVREPDRLTSLPDDERAAWTAIWTDIAALRKRLDARK